MDRNPRILVAAGIYPPDPGGPALHAKKQYEWLKSRGIATEVVVLGHYRKFPKFLRHVIYLVVLLTKIRRYDIIYGHDAFGVGLPAMLSAKLFRKKLVLRTGGDLAWERGAEQNKTSESLNEWYKSGSYKQSLFYRLTKFILSRADFVIVPTDLLSNIYRNYYGVSKEKISTILNPVPEKKEMESKTEPLIIYASRLVAYKNLSFAIKAFAKTINQYPEVKFIIIGSGPERDNLEKLVDTLNIEDKVIFLGTVTQDIVLDYTSRCLFAIAPALTEFNPNYILQCMSYGKPFLISREHGLSFPVPEELQFDPRNERDLVLKMSNLLKQESYEQAVEKIKENQPIISWDNNLSNNFDLIKTLLKG